MKNNGDVLKLQCLKCGREYPLFPPRHKCAKCGGLLEYVYDYSELRDKLFFEGPLSQWRYRSVFPPINENRVVSLGEGGTPLQHSKRLAEKIGLENLFFKDETRNPTYSFRDRCASVMVSNALDLSYFSVLCASNGNLGASIAAYSSKAGLECHVVVPAEVDEGKLAQMMIYEVDLIRGGWTIEEAIKKAAQVESETGWYQATADLNPLVIEAQKVISYEIYEQGISPDFLVVPVGSGGTIYSVWKGFNELKEMGLIDSVPKMVCVQPEACSPVVAAYNKEPVKVENRVKPRTVVLAVLVSNPVYGEKALLAVEKSGGSAISVSDYEVLKAQRELAVFEGLFVEPASASTIAAVKKLVIQGVINKKEKVVCLLTGSGLKAPHILEELSRRKRLEGFETETGAKEEILKILREEPSYGYLIWKKMGKRITLQAVYQHLNQLGRKGFLTSYSMNGRKYFRITTKGRKALKALEGLKGI